jgi:DNA-binding NarL/FixJ family response regulator
MKKILICDDHPAIRKGIKQILEAEFSDSEFGEASSANEVIKKVYEKKWDILIQDIDMPGRNGFDVLKQLKDEGVKVPILVFSMHPEEQIAIRAIKLGAAGFLSKDTADEELIKAINVIMLGKKYITPSLAEQLVLQLENPENKAPHEMLSDREYQTLLLIAKGRSVSQIAVDISLGVPTISTYRSRILEKTGMKTNAELATYAIRNNLV